MNIIAIDTCCGSLNLALMKLSGEIHNVSVLEHNQQSKLISSTLQQLLQKHGLHPEDIDTILITKGPGSFTGIRIGLSFVAGFNALGGAKVYACNTLSVLNGSSDAQELRLLPAAKGTYYACDYKDFKPISEITILDEDKIAGGKIIKDKAPDAELMIKLFSDKDLRDSLFSENLEPIYIRESYF